jgi:hypothetical protein
MRIYGLDFTSAPSSGLSKAKSRKRLVLAVCTLEKGTLKVDQFENLNGRFHGDFSKFEAWLGKEREWIAGLDFPFGQPARLIDDLNWPKTWSGYVGLIEELGKDGFEEVLKQYKQGRPAGQKELRRETDCRAGAVSPMKLYGVPVGKMFFQGATRLLHSKLSIHPVRVINSEKRHVIEAYPALVARKCLRFPSPYKSDDPRKNTETLLRARQNIVNVLCGESKNSQFRKNFGFRVKMSQRDREACIDGPSGDFLDSVLCAVQAAWSFLRRESNYGIPERAGTLEGWICDPALIDDTGQ